MKPTIRQIQLPSGASVPVLGQGTWRMAEDPRKRNDEVAAMRLGVELGLTLIDTAEMYADGGAETLVGEALGSRRDDIFIVSKVLPENATRSGTVLACERSLRRLATDRIDLYLLHWRGSVPLADTLEGFETLVRDGKIRSWGVSNFDVPDMEELFALGGEDVQTDQVLYNLARRGIEYDLLPVCGERRIPIMAYSPIEQGRLLEDRSLRTLGPVARRHGVTPAQLALAWVLRQRLSRPREDLGPLVCTIPKMGTPAHVRENVAALGIQLSKDDLAELDRAFPPPRERRPLELL
jgi:diketogulonate reductase-like aldo/keto reductase